MVPGGFARCVRLRLRVHLRVAMRVGLRAGMRVRLRVIARIRMQVDMHRRARRLALHRRRHGAAQRQQQADEDQNEDTQSVHGEQIIPYRRGLAMTSAAKHSDLRRWIGIALRSAHLASVVLLGAHLLGAHGWADLGPQATFASGVLLFASELADGRVGLFEVAGVMVLAKLGLVAWMAWRGSVHLPVFWAILAVSSAISHAPRQLRHWPGRG